MSTILAHGAWGSASQKISILHGMAARVSFSSFAAKGCQCLPIGSVFRMGEQSRVPNSLGGSAMNGFCSTSGSFGTGSRTSSGALFRKRLPNEKKVGQGRSRYFSSVGNGGGKGGGALWDITSGPVHGDEVPRLAVRAFGEGVFQVNETLVHGSVLLLPKTYYIWSANTFEEITIESLSIFTLLYPTLEIIFIGCGDTMPGALDPALIRHFKQRGIILETSNSANAAATYNVLNGEGRHVAAALLALGPQEGRPREER